MESLYCLIKLILSANKSKVKYFNIITPLHPSFPKYKKSCMTSSLRDTESYFVSFSLMNIKSCLSGKAVHFVSREKGEGAIIKNVSIKYNVKTYDFSS